MTPNLANELFSLEGRVAVVTGGTGVLGSAMVRGLAQAGAQVGILGRRHAQAVASAEAIVTEGGQAMPLAADVLARVQLEAARDAVLERWDRIDILVNAAGGNMTRANTTPDISFFDLPEDALRAVLDLNLMGTLLPSQVFGPALADAAASSNQGSGRGCIVNISSMASQRAITRVVGYSAAKAAVDNFTRWLAVALARPDGSGPRVNAIAPGFFVSDQNRRLLLEEDGQLTSRGQDIVAHTPAGRFGEPEELLGALIWLCGPGASFVNGVVIPVDGGFSAFSGV
jgi:NAD(P)-dependent dehydrogenase (short-subunit alcohol dehydrogenase family)